MLYIFLINDRYILYVYFNNKPDICTYKKRQNIYFACNCNLILFDAIYMHKIVLQNE